ncbi:hypothetical protein Syun_029911 [Stephania yunnanensis]|uniref:Uncharacterized protein n=1 Tax=Stephania yunnanensis TaxID=152371 RepID=A0AAP0E9T9_9MAGN
MTIIDYHAYETTHRVYSSTSLKNVPIRSLTPSSTHYLHSQPEMHWKCQIEKLD